MLSTSTFFLSVVQLGFLDTVFRLHFSLHSPHNSHNCHYKCCIFGAIGRRSGDISEKCRRKSLTHKHTCSSLRCTQRVLLQVHIHVAGAWPHVCTHTCCDVHTCACMPRGHDTCLALAHACTNMQDACVYTCYDMSVHACCVDVTHAIVLHMYAQTCPGTFVHVCAVVRACLCTHVPCVNGVCHSQHARSHTHRLCGPRGSMVQTHIKPRDVGQTAAKPGLPPASPPSHWSPETKTV